jgi:predicted dehydrogenase
MALTSIDRKVTMDKTPTQSIKPMISNGSSPRIALIGCGAISEAYYLPVMAKHPSLLDKLVLVDNDPTRARLLANKYKVTTIAADYKDILSEVDAAIVALPIHLHYPISKEFLTMGKPVLCEKPLTNRVEDAQDLVKIAQNNNTPLAVNYLQRLIPSFSYVKELVVNQTYGAPRYIYYKVGEEFDWPTVTGFYFNSPVTSRGILRDRGAHVFDHICWWLGGKPELISSQNDAFGGSDAVAHVRFRHNGCKGAVMLSWLANIPCRYKVIFENGSIDGDVYDYLNVTVQEKNGRTKQIALKSKVKDKIGIANQIVTNFVHVVNRVEKPLISGEDVLDSIEFIDECYASAKRLEMPWYQYQEVKHGS